MEVANDANITTTDKTTIGNAIVNGNFENISKDTEVTDKLITKDTKIKAENSVNIASAVIDGDLNLSVKNADIDDMSLSGTLTAQTDIANINANSDLSINSIAGNSKPYTETLNLNVKGDILDSSNSDNSSILAKNIDMQAKSIGSEENPININLSENNNVNIQAANDVVINTTGANSNINNISSENLALNSDKDININQMNVDTATIKTTSDNVNIEQMTITEKANISNANKKVVVDNTNFAPVLDADLQLYLTQVPATLELSGSNNVITNTVNVVGKDENILVNNNRNTGMHSAVASAAESSMNNTNVAHKTTEKVNSWLHAIANQKVYADSIISKTIKALILNHKNETFMTEDAFDVINTKKTENTDESSLDSEKISQK